MTNKLDIETTLDRSLRRQVTAPRLDGRFDAAVWSRIDAETKLQPASIPVRVVPAAALWQFSINAVGISVALVLVLYFGVQSFGGVAHTLPTVPAAEFSAATLDLIGRVAGWSVTGASLAFGLAFTSLGRRLRSELRQFL